jgi:hypothetical protein
LLPGSAANLIGGKHRFLEEPMERDALFAQTEKSFLALMISQRRTQSLLKKFLKVIQPV